MISSLPPVIVIDDSIRDLELFSFACEAGEIPVHIMPFTDGKDAIIAMQTMADIGAILPQAIIVDLNMPAIPGVRVIEFIKAHPVLSHIPVYVLTMFHSPRDRKRCQDLGVTRYLVKPSGFRSLVLLLKDVLAPPTNTVSPEP